MDALAPFSPQTRAWFENAFERPTPAQELGWPAIASGEHVLIQAPTGSGKTLAAFLYGIDRLTRTRGEGVRLLYVSPLKALNYDIERNLRGPLAGLQSDLRVAVRTGDTPQRERQAMLRKPPDILITTPESLFLLLTSQAREALRSVETVIVDEVHAVAGGKRGTHLAVSLERLDALLPRPAQRIGLSATVRPVDEVSDFLAGGRPVRVVKPDTPKTIEARVEVPVEDMTALPVPDAEQSRPVASPAQIGVGQAEVSGGARRSPSIWPAVDQRIHDLVAAHRSTIVFVNSRRLAERITSRLNELHGEPKDPAEFPAEAIGQSGVAPGVAGGPNAKAPHGSL
jgi:ATP-dependent helicase Lhr and Lhr-like helicase